MLTAADDQLFTGLSAQTYQVIEVVPAGWFPLTRALRFIDLSSGSSSNDDFANVQAGTISAAIFYDQNRNGIRDASEGQVAYFANLYADTNFNGVFDSGEPVGTSPGIDGAVVMEVVPGTYRIRLSLQGHYIQTAPAKGYVDVTVTAGKTVAAGNFGAYDPTTVLGGDIAGELTDRSGAALAGWTVYLDANHNGKLDAGELKTVTDATGQWSFRALSAGKYVVRILQQAAFTATAPLGNSFTITLAAGQSAPEVE
jgi:uncharacterized protein (DUF2141 family)